MKNCLIGPRDTQLAHFSGLVLGVDNFRGGDGHGGVNVAALAHPFVVVNLAEVTHTGVGKKRNNEIAGTEIFRQAQRSGDAAADGAAGEQALQLREAARHYEALLVVDLNDVVDNLQVHGRREKVFADAFDDIGFGLDGFAALDKIVVERTVRIHADNFDVGIFLLQVFPDAADRPAGAHAAHEGRDFAFAVFPDFRAGGAVVRLGIHGVLVLIRIIRIGNFASELFRDGIVAPRVLRLDGGGADNDFGAQGLEKIDFFLGLFVRGGEDALVAAHGGNQGKSHAGIAGGAFDNRAARFEEAFLFGVVNHGDADAVLHRAAGIGELRFDVHLRLEALIDAVHAHQRRVSVMLQEAVVCYRVILQNVAPPF